MRGSFQGVGDVLSLKKGEEVSVGTSRGGRNPPTGRLANDIVDNQIFVDRRHCVDGPIYFSKVN